jgi:phosphoglycerate dehydrogenase-like enzyme
VAAGLDEIITPALLARGVAVTSASGVHGPNIAEHLLAMILMFTREMPKLFRAQRGAVIDQAALVEALRAGRRAGAGLDVFEEEPLPTGSPLWDL